MKKILVSFIVFFSFCGLAGAQCKIENNFFNAGEELDYDLYFKYGILFMKAGDSSLKTIEEFYDGKDALKVSLFAESSGTARKLFTLTDTLTGYMTKKLEPLAFVKGAFEGDDLTQEWIDYKYKNDGIDVHTKRIKNGNLKYDKTLVATNCIYDMISVVYYARTLDYSSMKIGASSVVEFMSGHNKLKMSIVYNGTEKMKMNDGKKYDCIKLTLNIQDDAFENEKEAMKVFMTNDNNRLPIRLDSKLKIGSTRAILKGYKGNKYPVKTY